MLEVGAGDGRFVSRLRAAGFEATGIEPSEARGPDGARPRGSRGESRAGGGGPRARQPRRGDRLARARASGRSGRGAGANRRLVAPRRPRRGRLSQPGEPAGSESAAIGGSIRTCPGTGRTSPRPGFACCSSAPGSASSGSVTCCVEQNPLGMWQTLLNRITRQRDVAFRALKRDLGREPGSASGSGADRDRRAACWCLLRSRSSSLAGLAGRGGSVVAVAEQWSGCAQAQ